MAKQRRAAARPNPARRVGTRRKSSGNWQSFLLVGGAVVVVVFAVLFVRAGGGGSEVNAEQAALAAQNADGSEVVVLSGGRHTVYHSNAPLPTVGSPRADGKPTLVWFSGTWCEFCEHMEPYAHGTASQFGAEMIFVEKSVDDDRSAAARYGVRGTPTFVLIDETGQEVARFGFQSTRVAFAGAITAALSQLG